MKLLMSLFVLVFSILTLIVFVKISNTQNEPYMDEIFHIPQAKIYCDSNFSYWDPMITTPPGLYIVSLGLYSPLASLGQIAMADMCTTFWLRATNIGFALGNFYMIYTILKKIHNPLLDESGVKLSMTTLALSTFPVLYFFTFLYYTDAGSTFFVLLMYLFSLYDTHKVAAVMGTLAIMFRQTNIVWVVFVAGLAVRKELVLWMNEELSKKEKKFNQLSDFEQLTFTFDTLWRTIIQRRSHVNKFVISVLKSVWIYIVLGVGFTIFLVSNGGIVLGDKTQHTACLNIPQVFYFLSVANFFAIFHFCSPNHILDFLKFCWRRILVVVLFLTISFVIVYYFTYEHKYLLADNRHYTFYVWSKIYKRHEYVKFILIPAYLFFTWNFITALGGRDVFWKIVFCVSVIMTTVPQKLLEFRYFILPYIIFRMNMPYGTRLALFHELLLYTAVNIATVYLFVQKPFRWAHEEGVQRFIW